MTIPILPIAFPALLVFLYNFPDFYDFLRLIFLCIFTFRPSRDGWRCFDWQMVLLTIMTIMIIVNHMMVAIIRIVMIYKCLAYPPQPANCKFVKEANFPAAGISLGKDVGALEMLD